ncbi:maleylacetoacetate isomerase [Burkholderia plantarii]|uniref:maleylacetoacetate isomerase n=1 Tax=Burkholderia plantarii TaxID=41899 RepID=UPI0006D8BDA1|nr:maleylacetoacetate isomerase [Burkholderia plantarii]ALK31973.1 glutathione S-transferase [Burkholderia plantarii]GLZ21113.1 maleylacetoacetate isomerase [Burkholderia plantarii]
MELYGYFRSSASYRVRIALHLKGLPFDYRAVHMLRGGGEQLRDDYRALNPDALVPTLVDGDTTRQQSLAIIEYLDEIAPEPPLLPRAPAERACVRAIALQIACEIHPLDNLRVLRYLKRTLGVADEAKNAWYRHWITEGFATLETRLANDPRTGRLAYGNTPTIADCCLIPQLYNAQRFGVDLAPYPTLVRIHDHAMTLDAFRAAAPEAQPDAE